MEMSTVNEAKPTEQKKLKPSESYQLKLKDYAILMEYKAIKESVETGVYVIPGFESLHNWYGVIFVHEGEYQGGAFKFIISLPETYPNKGKPKVTFETKIFHPLIDPQTKELELSPANLSTEKEELTKGYMSQLLKYLKEIFYFHEKYWRIEHDQKKTSGIQADVCPNISAAKLFIVDNDKFRLKCNESVRESMERMKVGADPGSSLRFGPYMDSHEVIREKILRSSHNSRSKSSYLQWFNPGVRGMSII
eukprot:CAMPEP_0184483744 /NCGR_PEP_ID=MMETSP0113_2-20130426/5421_1 /TAXON_ID=91329 /ORGANISM="Norrisiella sphaerica, Strain BC52" /LENGTH=249 /DNA_ID=CAMNT_0026864331 /DNA_START=54 /DNA_END=803 /DNA_ORIENTATION=-